MFMEIIVQKSQALIDLFDRLKVVSYLSQLGKFDPRVQ